MATNVSICSSALVRLGDTPIASLAENTVRAMQCANIYPTERAALLRLHPWNCAIRRVLLAPMATAPAYGWTRQFALPGDHLRTLSVGRTADDRIDYETEGRRILANVDELPLRFVCDATEDAWDDLLVALMIQRMVWRLAYPVTKSTSKEEAERADYLLAEKRAKAVDGQENPPEELQWESEILASRAR